VLLMLWHAHLWRFYTYPNVARAIWWAYLLSGAIASLAAIAMVVLREPAALYSVANGRAVGTFVLPGELAGFLIFLIPISYALARTTADAAMRLTAWIACASGVVAMALTFSRTGWVGLAAGVAFLIAVRSPRGGALRAGAVIAAALVLVLALFNEHHNPSENYTRISIWQAAVGVIDRFPLTGVGPFGFSKIYPLVRLPDGDATAFHAHSLYLTLLAEIGIVGLAAFAWVLIAFGRALYERVQRLTSRDALLPLAIAAGVAGALVQGLIDTVSIVLFGLLIPMLALAIASAQSPELAP
jgi:putative inorganic carbon (hco3(-)) transporter